ncbi:phage holin family protein [Waterburya agarophytonicola K14]|uniref:Phage holin family protein n=1 Tax=Waterburya agarophytonicola KI4 TaxID=2874699 RepID=A0A964BQX1_9CYAN|nr:phage holin family protein [Waterburya agarophytonicola]MCC0177142.1 phage holin family protein [Waterburya agarophytonicola KI4]
MLGTFLTILATTLSLLVVDIIFPGVSIANFPAALIAAASIGIINAGVKPVISLLSLPLNILTLGGFSLIINGFCFWLASLLVPGFRVAGLIAFLVAPLILSSTNTLIGKYFGEKDLLTLPQTENKKLEQ